MDEIKPCTCETCKFSRTEVVFDPCVASMKETIKKNLPNFDVEQLYLHTITKCYIQGPPQRVNPTKEWCYKWETN